MIHPTSNNPIDTFRISSFPKVYYLVVEKVAIYLLHNPMYKINFNCLRSRTLRQNFIIQVVIPSVLKKASNFCHRLCINLKLFVSYQRNN